MIPSRALVGLTAITFAGVAPATLCAQPAPFGAVSTAAAGLDSGRLAQADSIADKELPALLGLAILRRGQLAWERYWHGGSADSAFNVKSVSKSFLSALVGLAVHDGSLRLDQTVASLLPEYYPPWSAPVGLMFAGPAARMDSARRRVTIGHLLTMMSGYAWEENGPITAAFLVSSDPVRFAIDLPMDAEPGTKFNYNTGGTHVLSAALARATGTSNREYAERRLFQPAGIALSRWDVDRRGVHVGGSEMYFTVRDLLRFGQLYLDGGLVGKRQVIPKEWVDQSWAKHTDVATPSFVGLVPKLDGYGYLWWRRNVDGIALRCALGFGGQFVMVAPALELVIAGGSALDTRNPGTGPQFAGIFKLVDGYFLQGIGSPRASGGR